MHFQKWYLIFFVLSFSPIKAVPRQTYNAEAEFGKNVQLLLEVATIDDVKDIGSPLECYRVARTVLARAISMRRDIEENTVPFTPHHKSTCDTVPRLYAEEVASYQEAIQKSKKEVDRLIKLAIAPEGCSLINQLMEKELQIRNELESFKQKLDGGYSLFYDRDQVLAWYHAYENKYTKILERYNQDCENLVDTLPTLKEALGQDAFAGWLKKNIDELNVIVGERTMPVLYPQVTIHSNNQSYEAKERNFQDYCYTQQAKLYVELKEFYCEELSRFQAK